MHVKDLQLEEEAWSSGYFCSLNSLCSVPALKARCWSTQCQGERVLGLWGFCNCPRTQNPWRTLCWVKVRERERKLLPLKSLQSSGKESQLGSDTTPTTAQVNQDKVHVHPFWWLLGFWLLFNQRIDAGAGFSMITLFLCDVPVTSKKAISIWLSSRWGSLAFSKNGLMSAFWVWKC